MSEGHPASGLGWLDVFAVAGSIVMVGGRSTGQENVNPAALPLESFLDEVDTLLTQNLTPNEVAVKAEQRVRWAERDGTDTKLLQHRSQSLSTLPGR